jgi:hypothetical protein
LAIATPQRKPKFMPPGKPKGAVAKITRDIKNGVLTAAENLGSDGNGTGGFIGYCEYLGRFHPKAFAHLLGKMLPLQVHSEGLVGASIGTVNVISVPADHYVKSPGDGTGMPVIEHLPSELSPAPMQEFAASSQHETRLIAALENLSVETLEQLAASLGDQG